MKTKFKIHSQLEIDVGYYSTPFLLNNVFSITLSSEILPFTPISL